MGEHRHPLLRQRGIGGLGEACIPFDIPRIEPVMNVMGGEENVKGCVVGMRVATSHSRSGTWTTKAVINMRLKGMGRLDAATESFSPRSPLERRKKSPEDATIIHIDSHWPWDQCVRRPGLRYFACV